MMNDVAQSADGHLDVERAIDELAERLPPPIQPLARIAYNYRWAWLSGGAGVFRDLAPSIWRRSDCNPCYIIEAVAPRRLRALAEQKPYVEQVRDVAQRIDVDLQRPWAETCIAPQHPVA